MAGTTYGDLLQVIALDLNRPDLSLPQGTQPSVIEDYADGRIRYFQRDFFYGSPQTDIVQLVAGQALYPYPTDMVKIGLVRLDYQSVWQPLQERSYEWIQYRDLNLPSTLSVPVDWAPFGLQFRLWPVPDKDYLIEVTGSGKIPAPVLPTDRNFWTTDAANMIRYATTAQIRLLRLRDQPGFDNDMLAMERERINLLHETTAKESANVLKIWW